MALSAASRIVLADGCTMPAVGFGCYQIKNHDVARCCRAAVGAGYPHVDTAEVYRNESGVGEALRGATPRPYVTSKLWPGNPDWGQTAKTFDAAVAACEATNKALGFAPDLYLIHGPFSGGPDARREQWKALVECKRRGLCASIGVSNFGVAHLEELAAAGLEVPAANQIELHPLCQKKELLAYMRSKRIAPIAYSSLAPLSNWREGQQSAKENREGDAVVAAVAAAAGKTEAQCLLRWALQKGYAILPKSTTEARIVENIQLFDFALDDDAMASLDALDAGAALAFGAPGARFDPTTAA